MIAWSWMGKTHSYRKFSAGSLLCEYEWLVKISPDCRFPCWLDGSVRTQASREGLYRRLEHVVQ